MSKFSKTTASFINTANFNSVVTETNTDGNVLLKKALIAVEGKFEDSDGVPHEFSVERLNTIANHTNNAIASGFSIPICKDHDKTVTSTIGSLSNQGTLYTKIITEEDLPNKKSVNLIGKTGLFADNAAITDFDAKQKINSKTITSVSMGLNLDPRDHRLMELSLVPIPAIPHMGFFKNKHANFNNMDTTKNAFTWEDLEVEEQSLEGLEAEYLELTQDLWLILNNIYTSESIDITDIVTLQQYVYNALNGFSIRVLDVLGLSNVPQDTMTDAASMSADQSTQMAEAQMTDVAQSSANAQQASYSRKLSLLSKFKKYYV